MESRSSAGERDSRADNVFAWSRVPPGYRLFLRLLHRPEAPQRQKIQRKRYRRQDSTAACRPGTHGNTEWTGCNSLTTVTSTSCSDRSTFLRLHTTPIEPAPPFSLEGPSPSSFYAWCPKLSEMRHPTITALAFLATRLWRGLPSVPETVYPLPMTAYFSSHGPER